MWGKSTIPGRTFQGRGCGATCRPDEAALGVPEGGEFTAAVRDLYAPVAAERPPRAPHDLFPRCTGVALSARGAQGLMERTAQPRRAWQVEPEREAAEAVAEALSWGDGGAQRRVDIARAGVMALSDGRGQAATVGPSLVHRRESQAEVPTLGTILARRDGAGLGALADLALHRQQVLREADWERLRRGESVGDGAPGMWQVAEAACPGVRQTLDDDHLSAHLDDFAPLLYPNNPVGAKVWVDEPLGALRTGRSGKVLGALKRMRPWGGAVEGAGPHVLHSRFTRAGMRWKPPGLLHVLALRLAQRNGTFQAFRASRGLVT